MTEELKPCAHCESDAISSGIYELSEDSPEYCGDDARMVEVRCEYCGIGVKYITDLDYSEKLLGQLIGRWNRRASPWVKVKDGKPKKGECVAMRIDGQNYFWLRGFYRDRTWFDECGYTIDFVTHWMPIPEIEK